jgi:indole-3-glycerol phosphate synthase
MDVLNAIAEGRRRDVEEMKRRVPGHVLRAQLSTFRPPGRVEHALRRPEPAAPLRLIAEVKRASPSKGVLHPGADPLEYARLYEEGGAAAVSLVTEPHQFGGSLEWVNQVRPHVRVPILLKDFVVDGYQVLDAAVRGADAVLLLASLHSDVQLGRLLGETRLLGLDALVEVHDEAELRRALHAGATMVGINNRDLRTLEVDPERCFALLDLVPPLVTAVAESGFARPDQVGRLRQSRADAALIGEALMTAADPRAVLAALRAAAG